MADSHGGHGGGNEKLKQAAGWALVIILGLAFLESRGGISGLIHGAIRGTPLRQPYAGSVSPQGTPVGEIFRMPAAPEVPSHYVGEPIPPRVVRVEHPPGTPNQYRCDAETGRRVGPGEEGNAWCD